MLENEVLEVVSDTTRYVYTVYGAARGPRGAGGGTRAAGRRYAGQWPVLGRDFVCITNVRALPDGSARFVSTSAPHPSKPPTAECAAAASAPRACAIAGSEPPPPTRLTYAGTGLCALT